MSGPEHFMEAQSLIGAASEAEANEDAVTAQFLLAEAQVHATLALAAATLGRMDHDWSKAMRAT